MRDYLNDFLSPYARGYEDLTREVGRSFGTPRLVVASGSVLQGFGNRASDVDLHTAVDDDRVTDFHLSFHDMGFSVDVNYVEEQWIRAAADHSRPEHRSRPRHRAEWKEEERRLTQLGRFALGLPLSGDSEWLAWQQGLLAGFADFAAWWWCGEMLRARTAAELLAATAPLACCLRYCDAGLAALNVLAAHAGEPYPNSKWLGLKLARLGWADLATVYDEFLDLPTAPCDAIGYLDRARARLDELSARLSLPDDPVVALTPAQGVEVWKVQNRHLVHRWGLRGVELTPQQPDERVVAELTWSGRLSTMNDSARSLVANGMCWLACWESAA